MCRMLMLHFPMLHVIDFALDVGRNICHGSDSVTNADIEIKLWFGDDDDEKKAAKEHKRVTQDIIYELSSYPALP